MATIRTQLVGTIAADDSATVDQYLALGYLTQSEANQLNDKIDDESRQKVTPTDGGGPVDVGGSTAMSVGQARGRFIDALRGGQYRGMSATEIENNYVALLRQFGANNPTGVAKSEIAGILSANPGFQETQDSAFVSAGGEDFDYSDIMDQLESGEFDITEAKEALEALGLDPTAIAILLQPYTMGRRQELDTDLDLTTSQFDLGELPENLGQAIDPFLEEEAAPERLFRGFASQAFGPGMSRQARESLQNQFGPANLSFLLGMDPEGYGATGEPEGRFREFLRGGGDILGPDKLAKGITGLAGEMAGGTGTSPRSEYWSDNPRAFENVLGGFLPSVNPRFRGAYGGAARDLFSRFQYTNPGSSFLQFLGKRGGRLFGQTGTPGMD